MALDRFLVGFIDGNSTLQTDLRPWLIADNAFETLQNVYAFRGRIRKRFGGTYMIPGAPQSTTRFRVQVNTTDGSGAASGTVPGNIFGIGQLFSIGTEFFTVQAIGTPVVMLDTGSATTKTFNTSTGAYVFAGTALTTAVYFYPALPVMGLTNYEVGPINDQPSYGFDTEFAYVFIAGSGWERSVSGSDPVWHGTNLNFFWTTNWQDITTNATILFVTNFNATVPTPAATDDPLWSFDGTTWTPFIPYFAPAGGDMETGPFVQTCRIILPFKDRLILLNTIENDGGDDGGINSTHTNRCRYSFNGSPFARNAWYEPNQSDSSGGVVNNNNLAAGAGFLDATTKEAIISAEFIKDRLIVFFERSTWELAYTGNQILPFLWQKINTELGSESQQSAVPFDKQILTIGNTGVHACSGANVERIDNKIPDEIFKINDSSEGVQRVAGIRDYFVEMVYWTFPALGANPEEGQVYPNRVLVYNYKNNAWAFNDDCITAWGYFEQQQDLTWAQSTFTWEETEFTWISGVEESQSRQVIAGNQEGYTFIVNADLGRNAAVLQITNITINGSGHTILTIIDHTLNDNLPDFIAVENSNTALDGQIFKIQALPPGNPLNTVDIGVTDFVGSYSGGGVATRVSNINFKSKQWNPYAQKGQNVYVAKIDFGVFKTEEGEITVDYSPSATELSMINAGIATSSITGDSILETHPYPIDLAPLEQEQQRLWHPIYFQSEGTCIQIAVSFSVTQITNPIIAWSDFELEAMILHTMAVSNRIQ
jgi:hypothetical protein